ncbi:MAG: amidohydrolase [Pseudomonadales bacterium]|nr:amidohydrolase [Pseudomonadales bacterium]
MKSLIVVLFIGLLLPGCHSQPTSPVSASGTDTHLLIHGGTIIGASDPGSAVDALLISTDKVIAMGDYQTLLQMAPSARQLDLAGRTLIPGITDSHAHVRELGTDAVKADLVGTHTTEEMVARLQAKFPNPEPGQWLLGQGWDEGEFASRGYPDRAALDAAFPDNPVLLESLHGFANFSNGAALALAGIDAGTPNPEVGQILKRENGEPTGVMLTLAQKLISDKVPPFTQAQLQEAIVAGLKTMAAAGVTSVHEAGMTPADVTAYNNLAEQGQLPIRVYGLLNGNDNDLMAYWFERGILERPDHMFAVRGIKVFYDGSLGSRTAMLQAPYSDHPERAHPTERISPAAVTALADQAAAKGFQMAVHAIGDEGNNRILNIYEQAMRNYPDRDHRWRIEHAQVVLPDYFNRVASAGIISSMQSSHAVGDSGWAEDRLGSERIHYAYAWQKVLAAGGVLAINSDLPGEPWEPMQTLYFAVNRSRLDGTPEGGWYADEALTVEQALHGMTLAGAYSAFQDQVLGSLAPGKYADFIIVDRNPLLTPAKELASIRILSTWVAGQQVSGESLLPD